MSDRENTTRECTFEEEAELYIKEAREVFAEEDGFSEPPAINCILRRGMRIIRKAREEISNGVTVQKWIPVWEKMPKQEAQAHQNKYGEFAMFLTMIKGAVLPTALSYDVEKNSFFDFHYDSTVQYYEVTHWMPLPEPPKECE